MHHLIISLYDMHTNQGTKLIYDLPFFVNKNVPLNCRSENQDAYEAYTIMVIINVKLQKMFIICILKYKIVHNL